MKVEIPIAVIDDVVRQIREIDPRVEEADAGAMFARAVMAIHGLGWHPVRGVSTQAELALLEPGTVLRGPDWHGEVYHKAGEVEFYAPGSESPWLPLELAQRGPFVILWEPEPRGSEEDR